eukprot:NODE_400_length_8090_cov_0.771522.p6 type:complete len:108 gc:universal NODE_400_length_8090_cov_0.771522:539-862(+)
MNKSFDFTTLTPTDMDMPSFDARQLHFIIKSTMKKYSNAHFTKKMQMRSLLKRIQYMYPLTFTCLTEQGLTPKEVVARLQHMVKGKVTTVEQIESDPMYGNLTHDLL